MFWKCKQGSYNTGISGSSLVTMKGHFSVVLDLLKKEIPSSNLSAVYCPIAPSCGRL